MFEKKKKVLVRRGSHFSVPSGVPVFRMIPVADHPADSAEHVDLASVDYHALLQRFPSVPPSIQILEEQHPTVKALLSAKTMGDLMAVVVNPNRQFHKRAMVMHPRLFKGVPRLVAKDAELVGFHS